MEHVCVQYEAPTDTSGFRQRVRKILFKMTVENKEFGLGQETIFDFKHVPQIGLTTPLGDTNVATKRRRPSRAEQRSLFTLCVVTTLMGTAAWFGLRSSLRVMGVDRVVTWARR